MHDAVRTAFRPFSAALEGVMRVMYLDVKGLVTTGIGNLIDPIDAAMRLPWRLRSTGRLALPDEIEAEWRRIKSAAWMRTRSAAARAEFGRLELDDAGLDTLFVWRLAEDERVLKGRIRNYDALPADAQLAVHSMAWGMGPWFRYPRCLDAILHERFAEAAIESHCPDFNDDRNAANRSCFLNADQVAKRGLPRDVLHWPEALHG